MKSSLIEIVTIIALVVGPVIAVFIGYRLQNYRARRDIKHEIFLTMMTHRREMPPNPALVDSLNILDVVFHKDANILGAWHEYFESTCQPNPTPVFEGIQQKKYLDLFYEIGRTLGYKNLRQTDIDTFYNPKGSALVVQKRMAIEDHLLRVLNNSENFGAPRAEDSTNPPAN